MDYFQTGKEVRQGYILLACLFSLYAKYLMRNAKLDELQARIRIAGRNINNLRYADGRNWRGTKEPLNEGEIREWKSWLEIQY